MDFNAPRPSLAGALALLIAAQVFGRDYATARLETRRADSDGSGSVVAARDPGNARGSAAETDALGCPTTQSLVAAVEARLGRPLFVQTNAADLKVLVQYGQGGAQWYADVSLLNAQRQPLGQRRISSNTQDCAGIDDSLVLVIALMVDLTREDVKARFAPEAPHRSEYAPEPHVPPTAEARNWSTLLTLSAVGSLGQLPKPAWGLQVGAELRSKSLWSVEFGFLAFAPATIEDGARARAEFMVYGAELGLCLFAMRRSSGDLQLCTGSRLGIERAAGTGYASNSAAQFPWFSPFLAAESTWWPGRLLGLRLGIGVAAPLTREQFYATRVDGSNSPLFKPAVVAAFLNAGVSLAL